MVNGLIWIMHYPPPYMLDKKVVLKHIKHNSFLMQIEEEDLLIAELKKIELRKKEREKKTQDLQKLITAADSNIDSKKADKRQTKKKIHLQQKFKEVVGFTFMNLEWARENTSTLYN